MTDAVAVDAFASTLPPPPSLSPLEVDAVLDVALAADLSDGDYTIPPKVCSCGREHDAAAWAQLPFCGVQDDVDARFELRHCPCGSTIAVLLCAVEACQERPTWRVQGLRDYCEAHTNEWLRAESSACRHDFRDGDVCSKCDALKGGR